MLLSTAIDCEDCGIVEAGVITVEDACQPCSTTKTNACEVNATLRELQTLARLLHEGDVVTTPTQGHGSAGDYTQRSKRPCSDVIDAEILSEEDEVFFAQELAPMNSKIHIRVIHL